MELKVGYSSGVIMAVSLLSLSGCMELGSFEERAVSERSTYRRIDLDPRTYASPRGEVVEESGGTGKKAAGGEVAAEIPKPEELPIDLPTVLRLAGTDSLEVRLADERLNEARARILAADMQFLPSITPVFGNNWHRGRLQDTGGAFLDVDKQNSLVASGVNADLHIGESVFASLAARR